MKKAPNRPTTAIIIMYVLAPFLIAAQSSPTQSEPSSDQVTMLGPYAVEGYTYRVQVTKILHVGDPAPDLPSATVSFVGKPQIDDAGKVFLYVYLTGPGAPGGPIYYYGDQHRLTPVVRQGDQVAGMAPGVVYTDIGPFTRLSDNGEISFSAAIDGPGITGEAGCFFHGTPGNIAPFLCLGDQAPGLVLGVTLCTVQFPFVSETYHMANDNGDVLIDARVCGPGIDEDNDRVVWTGRPGDLTVAWREGDECPGVPGKHFAWLDGIAFNNDQWLVARMGTQEGGSGQWAGQAGGLQMQTFEGFPAPGMETDIVVSSGGGFPRISSPTLSATPYLLFLTGISGPGVHSGNNVVIWGGQAGQLGIIAREGDPIPDVSGATYGAISPYLIGPNESNLIFARMQGPGITTDNDDTHIGGSPNELVILLREGTPPPGLIMVEEVLLSGVPSRSTGNDLGDWVVIVGLAGDSVSELDNELILLRDSSRSAFFPLLRSGTVVGNRTVTMDGVGIGGLYWGDTNGGDGGRTGFSDQQTLALVLEFDDGTHGAYLVEPLWQTKGDSDADGDVDLVDFAQFQLCYTGPVDQGIVSETCSMMDFDSDGDIDLVDFSEFQLAFTGAM